MVFESQAQKLRQDVLRLAKDRNLDSAEVVAAMADVVATVAAMQDRQGGTASLPDRLHSFGARVEETYQRMLRHIK